ncbi:MAG: class I SAM-dependent methyltransferase, partial [Acidimicrobiia bacterium]|nr:class I SAM-dependent methyltransferase [Acidimicrobiia bacterium]
MEPFRRSALVYDLIYEQRVDYDWHVANLRDLITGRLPDAKSLAEMAVGTGQILSRMRRWFEVVGCDISPNMLAVCRERHPELDVRLGDYSTIDLGQSFDAVICVFSSIGYVRTVDRLHAAFENFARHLNEGGVIIVDGWLRPANA